MPKIKLSKIWEIKTSDGIKNILDKEFSGEEAKKVAYWLARIANKIESEHKNIEIIRKKLIADNGDPVKEIASISNKLNKRKATDKEAKFTVDELGKLEILQDKVDIIKKEFNEYLDVNDCDIDINLIKLKDFPDGIKPTDLMCLNDFIQDDTKPIKKEKSKDKVND